MDKPACGLPAIEAAPEFSHDTPWDLSRFAGQCLELEARYPEGIVPVKGKCISRVDSTSDDIGRRVSTCGGAMIWTAQPLQAAVGTIGRLQSNELAIVG